VRIGWDWMTVIHYVGVKFIHFRSNCRESPVSTHSRCIKFHITSCVSNSKPGWTDVFGLVLISLCRYLLKIIYKFSTQSNTQRWSRNACNSTEVVFICRNIKRSREVSRQSIDGTINFQLNPLCWWQIGIGCDRSRSSSVRHITLDQYFYLDVNRQLQ